MKAIVPKTFRTGGIVDSEDVNANLQAIARDLQRLIDQRYTYSTLSIDVTGLVDTDTTAERTINFQGSTLNAIDVVGVELSIYGADGDTWTLSATDENGTVLALAVATVTATSEGYASSNVPLQIDTALSLVMVLSCATTATITRGAVTIHCRTDRHFQDGASAPAPYVPTLIDASTSTGATAINAELASAAAKRTANASAANNQDTRGMCIVADNLAAAVTWRIPSSGSDLPTIFGSAVGAAARSVAISDGTSTLTLNTTGTSNIVEDQEFFGLGLTVPCDPTDTADDLVLTLTPTGGAISRVFVFIWWS